MATVTNPGSFMATITHPTGNGYCRDRILRVTPPSQTIDTLEYLCSNAQSTLASTYVGSETTVKMSKPFEITRIINEDEQSIFSGNQPLPSQHEHLLGEIESSEANLAGILR